MYVYIWVDDDSGVWEYSGGKRPNEQRAGLYIVYLYRYSYIIIRMYIWLIYICILYIYIYIHIYIWADDCSGLWEYSDGKRPNEQGAGIHILFI